MARRSEARGVPLGSVPARTAVTGAPLPARVQSVKIEVFDNQIEPALEALTKQTLAPRVFLRR